MTYIYYKNKGKSRDHYTYKNEFGGGSILEKRGVKLAGLLEFNLPNTSAWIGMGIF